MKYYLIAGEASGDLHGSNLMKGLKAEDPEAEFRFWGGDKMQAVGGTLVQHYKEGAIMGVWEILRKAGKLLGNVRRCKEDILQWQPDVVILIDYPGFNLKIAKFCHNRGIRNFYYIAPKTWASREGRNRKIKKWVDKLYIIFPFEIPYFTLKGIPFEYKGNPLIDAVDAAPAECPEEGPYIALLAGSRKGEIKTMMPTFMDVADTMRAMPKYSGYKFVIAGAPSRSEEDYTPYIAGREEYVKLYFGQTYGIIKHAEAAIVNSGTASLETALLGTPQVVAWATSKFTYAIAKILVKVKYISLANLIADKFVFKELVQGDFNTPAVVAEVRSVIEDPIRRGGMIKDYAAIRAQLGGTGASRAIAAAMIKEIAN